MKKYAAGKAPLVDEAQYPVRKDEKTEHNYYVRMAWYFPSYAALVAIGGLFYPAPFLHILPVLIAIWVFLLVCTDFFFITRGIHCPECQRWLKSGAWQDDILMFTCHHCQVRWDTGIVDTDPR